MMDNLDISNIGHTIHRTKTDKTHNTKTKMKSNTDMRNPLPAKTKTKHPGMNPVDGES